MNEIIDGTTTEASEPQSTTTAAETARIESLLAFLRCPKRSCLDSVEKGSVGTDKSATNKSAAILNYNVKTKELTCASCKTIYPVTNGIPAMFTNA